MTESLLPAPQTVTIRSADMRDIPDIISIETAAGERFRAVGMDEIADDEPLHPQHLAMYIMAEHAWVAVDADDRPIAYLLLKIVDHHPHIEQVSVHPAFEHQGIGRALLDHVSAWGRSLGFRRCTMTTFENVPWNAPYYERIGFRKLEDHEIGRGMYSLCDEEEAQGLTRWPRVLMGRDL